ncbi:MAG: magnesium transporter [Deltaproteobacteria bacterium]|nr:magnesium transporter [Deltaproteobacteria bacterium]
MDAQEHTTILEESIRKYLAEESPAGLKELLETEESVHLAAALLHFSAVDQLRLLDMLTNEKASEVLVELGTPSLEILFDKMKPDLLAEYLGHLEPDDAADLVGLLPEEAVEPLLQRLGPAMRAEVTHLLSYGPDTAGGLMDPDAVKVSQSDNVSQAVKAIRAYVDRVDMDDFFSVYVVDSRRRLVGAVPTWKLLLALPDEKIGELMVPDPISVPASMDQEEVSRLVRDHDLVSLPVVDVQGRLIGRITVDDVVDVIHEEHLEDISTMAGNPGEFIYEPSLVHSFRLRAPWLMLAFVGQLVSAIFLRSKEEYLVLLPQLAFFIPVIMAMGGNTGIQSSSLVIRGLATGEVLLAHFWRRLMREMLVALAIGVVFSGLLAVSGMLLTGNLMLGLVSGFALLCTILIASGIGISIPMVLRRLDYDPALATGPFLTTMNDIMGILIYLLVAHALLF